MINNARGNHVSPGVYSKEQEVIFTPEKINETTLGLVGETLMGPAFEPIDIKSWKEFKNYFGDTSAEKFVGSGFPKYELPYIAKEWLKESNSLKVCRVLGLSGYDAGKAFVIKGVVDGQEYALAVLRSRATLGADSGDPCEPSTGERNWDATSVTISAYTAKEYNSNCQQVSAGASNPTLLTIDKNNPGKFNVTVNGVAYPVSFAYKDIDYIYKVFGSGPFDGNTPVFVEAVYDYAIKKLVDSDKTIQIQTGSAIEISLSDYKDHFLPAVTPWIVSQAIASENTINVSKLFRIYTISDGNAANRQVKVSIQNIRPDEGLFDLVVRNYGDSDLAPSMLEKFSNCSMTEGTSNYVALKVGTIDGEYLLKSKYIALEMAEGNHADSVPCGFVGYELHNFGSIKNFELAYNTEYDPNLSKSKQYFGLSSRVGVDDDILRYKGKDTVLSNGFHLDSIFDMSDETVENGTQVWVLYDNTGKVSSAVTGDPQNSAYTMMYRYGQEGNYTYSTEATKSNKITVYVDGATGFTFTCVSPYKVSTSTKIPRIVTEAYMKDTIYAEKSVRKFTVYPAGGFDGWDIYREVRSNTNEFKWTKYSGTDYVSFSMEGLDLPAGANNSDYYAYLGGYRTFANPEEQDICLFTTPGIDAENNALLIAEVDDMIEDNDERNGDALYVYTTPQFSATRGGSATPYSAQEVVDIIEKADIDSSYMATYWPWVKCYDSADAKYINLPATKDVLRDMVYTDKNTHPWFCAAGIARGDVDCVKACVKTKLADEDILYAGRINPVKTFAADGVKIWGNKTTYSVDSPLNRVNARRLLIRLKKLVTIASRKLIFEQLDNTLESQFLSIVKPILQEAKEGRGIKKYKIEIDSSAEARDEHTLPAKISVMPINALEYIDLTFTIYPERVDFEE